MAKVIVATASWVIFAAVLFLLWPPQWGGWVSYVVVSGTSMEPEYHTGDIAVAVKQDQYQVGENVVYMVYEDGQPKGRIIHQLVRENPDGTFIAQGINKEHPDPWRIPEDWIQGSVVTLLPQGYRYFLILKSPIFLAVVAGLIVTAIFWPRGTPIEELGQDEPAETPAAGGADPGGGTSGD